MLPQTISPQRLANKIGPGVIVLDVDGTLAPLRLDPQRVRISQAVQAALARLSERRPVALVSGRPLGYLQTIAGHLPLLLIGSHGAESNQAYFRPVRPPPVPAPVRKLVESAAAQGLGLEEKPFGIVLHLRRLSPGKRVAVRDHWGDVLRARVPKGWEVLLGNAVVEIRPRGMNKGRVLAPLRKLTGTPIAAVLGDDLTDEDMFRALTPGEAGVLVGARRESSARFNLPGVVSVRQFLSVLAR